MRRLHTEIEIAAPATAVWEVLADAAAYPEWNPFVHELRGELRPGARISAVIGRGRRMRIRPTVLAVEPGRELRWHGRLGVRGLFDGEHSFVLEPLPDGRTRLVHAEDFRGILVPLLWRMIGADAAAGFAELNVALRDRVEQRTADA